MFMRDWPPRYYSARKHKIYAMEVPDEDKSGQERAPALGHDVLWIGGWSRHTGDDRRMGNLKSASGQK
jgi:hypothetical protein